MTKRNAIVILLLAGCLGMVGALAAPSPSKPPKPDPKSAYEEMDPIGGKGDLKFGAVGHRDVFAVQRGKKSVDKDNTKLGPLGGFCLNKEGNLLVCDSYGKICVVTPEGKLKATWQLDFAARSVFACDDGTVYATGGSKITKLDKDGKILKTIDTKVTIGPFEGKEYKDSNGKTRKVVGWQRKKYEISEIVVSGEDVFVSFGFAGKILSGGLCRLDRNLDNPVFIAKNLRGCCSRLALAVHDGVVYLAENVRFRVIRYDREGKKLGEWGKNDRDGVEGFGGCCNPMGLGIAPDGAVVTSESGLARIKIHEAESGTFRSVAGHVGKELVTPAGSGAAGCTSTCVVVNADGSRIYVQDAKNNIIRVLAKKKAKPQPQPKNE